MREMLQSLFGTYTPLTYEAVAADGSIVVTPVLGVAGVDWEWVAGVFLFSIVLYAFFRLVGVLLKNG